MTLVLEDTRALLQKVITTIDRKAEFNLALQEGDEPGVSVTITLRKHKGTIVVSERKLQEAARDSIGRSQLRTMIKRAIDRMTFEIIAAASTKMVRGTVVDGGFFRPHQPYRGGRR